MTAISAVDGFHLSYILAEEQLSDGLGNKRRTYSIFAAVCGDDGETDSSFIRDLTSSEAEARHFFKMIAEGAVTPCTLGYMAEDFLAPD